MHRAGGLDWPDAPGVLVTVGDRPVPGSGPGILRSASGSSFERRSIAACARRSTGGAPPRSLVEQPCSIRCKATRRAGSPAGETLPASRWPAQVKEEVP